jgi:hypothetical protein
MKSYIPTVTVGLASTLALAAWLKAGPPSADDVGDADSFGNNAVYLDAVSGFIVL